jgi:hypothetical protein
MVPDMGTLGRRLRSGLLLAALLWLLPATAYA